MKHAGNLERAAGATGEVEGRAMTRAGIAQVHEGSCACCEVRS
jgi:hypothetical protein